MKIVATKKVESLLETMEERMELIQTGVQREIGVVKEDLQRILALEREIGTVRGGLQRIPILE